MAVAVQKEAPNFKATAVKGREFVDIELKQFRGKYVVLFFYPLDFTFVCPTEIIAFDEKLEEFQKRNTEVIAVSVDSAFSHLAWQKTPRDKGGLGDVRYPLVADITKQISEDYGVLLHDGDDAGVALRGLFLIDKEGLVRHVTINDLPLGRSTDEVLRLVDALQYVEKHGEVCPANWHEGGDTIKPDVDGSQEYFSKHG
ncbi:MAG: peroxiredoxin [Myxococcota bacterium]|nr:peroxiredoxin [Myxococcota bacterium]